MAAGVRMRFGRPGRGGVASALRRGCLAASLLVAAGTGGLAGTAGAGAAGAGGAISEAHLLEAAWEQISGLVAAFTQTVESPALPSPQVESGTVYLLRPGRMRWEYSHPRGKLAIADGERTYLYLPEDRQALVAPLPRDTSGGGMELLLRSHLDLERDFTIGWGEPAEAGGGRPLRLTPRGGGGDYRELLLTTDADHLPRTLVVIDALGGRITYRFSDIRKVASLDAGLFHFTPPPGVKLQRVRP